jgi:uncharacterized protein YcfJ
MFVKKAIFFVVFFLIVSCSSTGPKIAVDPSSIESQEKYNDDFNACLNLAKTVDLSSEKAAKAVAGAAIGAAAVAGVATAVAGAVFAPAIPFMIAGGAAAGGLWGNKVSEEEKKARESILLQCLEDKGYKVYGSRAM